MAELAILVPVRERPQNVKPLLESIEQTTPWAHVWFLLDPGDEAELAAVRDARRAWRGPYRIDFATADGNYAAKIRTGVSLSDEPLVFLGADDLRFCEGWFEAARGALQDGIEVVGVNDLLARSREHATHFLMKRCYAERATIDDQPGPLFEGYSHWFCDDELIATATQRGAYAYCAEALVRHLHPMADTAPDDPTYERGRAHRWSDAKLFRRRRQMWA